jgi:hypothetical protein
MSGNGRHRTRPRRRNSTPACRTMRSSSKRSCRPASNSQPTRPRPTIPFRTFRVFPGKDPYR